MSRVGHPMGIVAERTGLSSHAIRAWERRYGVVQPSRSSGNHRLYSDADIARLVLLRRAVEAGRRIGDISGLDAAELETLLRQDGAPHPQSRYDISPGDPELFVEEGLEEIGNLDPGGLARVLSKATAELGILAVLSEVIGATLHRVGDLWQEGKLRVYHEHLASSGIRSYLGGILDRQGYSEGAPVVVSATPPRQTHEIGALMAAVCASVAGMRAVYLGSNAPVHDLARVCDELSAEALLLSIVYPRRDQALVDDLVELRSLCPKSCEIILGGDAAGWYAEGVDEPGLELVTDMKGLRTCLADR